MLKASRMLGFGLIQPRCRSGLSSISQMNRSLSELIEHILAQSCVEMAEEA